MFYVEDTEGGSPGERSFKIFYFENKKNKLHISLQHFLRHLVKFKIVYIVQRTNHIGQ